MELVRLNDIATTPAGLRVNLVLHELHTSTEMGQITTPWTLELKNTDGQTVRTLPATGRDFGLAFVDWYNSPAGQQIRALLAQQAAALLADPNSAIRRELDFFATLNPPQDV